MPKNLNENSAKDDTQKRNRHTELESPESPPPEDAPKLVGNKKRRASLTERWNDFMERRRQNGQPDVEETVQFGVEPCEDDTNNSFISMDEMNSTHLVTVVSNNNVETEVIESIDPPTKKTIVITMGNSSNIEQINIVMNFNKLPNEEIPPPLNVEPCKETITNNKDQEANAETNANAEANANDEANAGANANGGANANDEANANVEVNAEATANANEAPKEPANDETQANDSSVSTENNENASQHTDGDLTDDDVIVIEDSDVEEEKVPIDANEKKNDEPINSTSNQKQRLLKNDGDSIDSNEKKNDEPINSGSNQKRRLLENDGDSIDSNEKKNDEPVNSGSNQKRRLLENDGDSKKLRTSSNPDEQESNQNDENCETPVRTGLLLTVRSNPDGTSKINYLQFANSRESSPETPFKMLGKRVVSSEDGESPPREEFKERVTCTKLTDASKYPKIFTVRSTVTKPSDSEHLQVLDPTASSPEPLDHLDTITRHLMMLTPSQRARLRIIEQLILARLAAQNSSNADMPIGYGIPGCADESTNTSANATNPNLLGEIISRNRPSFPAQERAFYNKLTENSGNTTNSKVAPVRSNGSTKTPSNPTMPEENISRSKPANTPAHVENGAVPKKATKNSGSTANSKAVGESAKNSSKTENSKKAKERSKEPTKNSNNNERCQRTIFVENPTYEDYLDMIERHTCTDEALGSSVSSGQCDEFFNCAVNGEPGEFVTLNKPIKNYTYEEYLTIMKARASSNNRSENSSVAEPTKVVKERVSAKRTERKYKQAADSSEDASDSPVQRPVRAIKSFPNRMNVAQVRKIQAYRNRKRNKGKKKPVREELSDSDSS